jgi:hypothetical protein
MKKWITTLALGCALAACGDDDDGGSPDAGLTLGTSAQILAYMDGKSFKMDGNNIPSHPNGINEDLNAGAATQCYQSVNIAVASGNFTVTSALGTVEGAATVGQTGTCNHTATGTPLMFTSTTVLIENVQNNAGCFDITVTYPGFSQEGRGKISADGRTLTLELYFAGAQNHRCAAGAVGASGVILANQTAPFTGNAQQVYLRQ